MDKMKTGGLIAKMRKENNMTQQDVADKLHVTSKAVSKWERGISFPSVDILTNLAQVLGLSVMDILAGEVLSSEEIPAKSVDISMVALKKEVQAKRKIIAIAGVVFLLLFVIFLQSYGGVIFQRGNPLPYLSAAVKISPDTPFVPVNNKNGVYISKKGQCPQLFEFIEKSRDVWFLEQAGSGYIFTNGVDKLTVSSEIYWGRFTLWTVPNHTLQSP